MKKVIKLIIVIIILIIAIILINYIRNTVISNKIIMAGNDFFNSSNYHITIKTTMSDDYNVINEIYYKNDTCLINTYNNNKLTEIYWKNYLTEEKISYYPETLHTMNEFNEELITSLKDELMLKGNSVPIFDFIAKKDNSYIIKNQYINPYFNKETGLLVKKEYYLEENYNTLNNISEYKFELNTVTDEQVKNLKYNY